jgi:hypothetical protein
MSIFICLSVSFVTADDYGTENAAVFLCCLLSERREIAGVER